MENLKQTIAEVKTHNGEHKLQEIIQEKRFIVSRISWPAIFSGVLVTAVTQLLLSLLGVGIGLATVDPAEETNPMQGLGIASIIWWSLSMFISLFLGGWTTGKVCSARFQGERTIHGLLTWATFTVISFFLLTTSVGSLISGVGRVVGSAITAGAGIADGQLDISTLLNDAKNTMMQTGTSSEQDLVPGGGALDESMGTPSQQGMRTGQATSDQLFLSTVENFFRGGDINNPENRELMVNSLVNRGMNRAEANAKVDNWIRSYEDMKAQARVKADQAAQATSTASIIFFFALLIGALVTIWGSRVAPEEDYEPIGVD